MIPEQLALAGVHSPHLELLEIAVASHDNQAWEEVMQNISRMQTLRTLALDFQSGKRGIRPHCSCLAPLSALTQLHSLDLNLEACKGGLPPSLLPRLQHLTHLGLTFSRWFGGAVSWSAGAVGPPLHSLRLHNTGLHAEEATTTSLGKLESLRLQGSLAVPSAFPALLHSLSGLTSLELDWAYRADAVEAEQEDETDAEWSLQLVAGCSQLLQLDLHLKTVLELDLPNGALQRLSYLSLEDDNMDELKLSGSWASLPSLQCLRLAGGLWRLRLPNATLGGLKELDMGAIIYEWGDDEEDLLHFPDLTHLVLSDVSFERGLPPEHILHQLRQLSVQHYNPGWVGLSLEEMTELPGGLAQAASLEVLDLRGCQDLQLRKADAELLRQLTSLRRLEVASPQELEVVVYLRAEMPQVQLVEDGL